MLTMKDIERVERLFQRLGEEDKKNILQAIENRVVIHTVQKASWEILDKRIASGDNLFGIKYLPRAITEPERAEAVYILGKRVDKKAGGIVKAFVVTLRVWADMSCYEAMTINESLVARVCADGDKKTDSKFRFSTAMRTDVRTISAMMWLQLRGRFYWDKDIKSNSTSRFLDDETGFLYKIEDDDFKSWLTTHTQLTHDSKEFKRLEEMIRSAAMNPRVARENRPEALFARRGDILYISNGDTQMVRISPSKDGEALEIVQNGTDDVVFLPGSTLEPWEIVDGPGIDPFDKETGFAPFSTANYQTESGRMIARLWFLALPACIRSFPALLFTGLRRSGKSRTAKGFFELLGSPVRLAEVSVEKSGAKEFWPIVNKGGVVCFDNVDSKNEWFGDSMQLACTDGSRESRALFTNDQLSMLRANARIILTSNNPMFASESGLSDRLGIVRLLEFLSDGTKETADDGITNAIKTNRNAALTWLARTVSKAMGDKGQVQGNINMRHPDFARFALLCSRALNKYEDAILALKSAEFDKALLSVQSNTKLNYVFEAMQDYFKDPTKRGKPWSGKSSDLKKMIVAIHPDLENSKYLTDTGLGMALNRDVSNLAVLFDIKVEKGAQTRYTFNGFSAAYLQNVAVDEIENSQESSNNEEIDEDDAPW